MRVLIVWFMLLDANFYASNIVRVLRAIAKQGHQITCVLPALKETPLHFPEKLTVKQIPLHRSLPIFSYLYFCIRAIPQIIRSYRFNCVIISADMVPWIFPLLIGRSVLGTDSNVIFAVREEGPPVGIKTSRRYYRLLLRRLTLRMSRMFDVVFGVSPMHAREIATRFNVPRVHVWPPSVDERIFDPRLYRSRREMKRKSLSVSRKFVLLYHGVLSHERGLYELLRAIALVRGQISDVVLLILGRGEAEARLRSVVNEYELNDVVIFHGSVPYEEVPLFIAAADAGVVPLPVQPQWEYQTPIKLLEYLAMEKPVIVTETESHRWIVGNRREAVFCGAGKPEQIAKAVLECRKSHSLTGRRETILEEFSPDAIATSVLAELTLKNQGR